MDLEEKIDLILKPPTEEVITREELKEVLETNEHPVAYNGWEPSGRVHLGTGLICAYKMKDLIKAGVKFKAYLATWHAWINNKMGGDLDLIKKAAEHFKHSWIALGVPENKVGVDLGLENFATLSDGTVIENPRFLKGSERKLKRENRRLSKKKKRSINRSKQRVRLAGSYETLTNQRLDFLHKLSYHLTQQYDFIAIENLGVSNMVKNHYLAKSISDTSWSVFTGMLTYKAQSAGGELVEIDRFYPSSQICSDCGNKQDMPLSKRIYKCEKCGAKIPRDKNSAINILREGINTAGRVGIHACGDLTSTDQSASRVVEAGTICN